MVELAENQVTFLEFPTSDRKETLTIQHGLKAWYKRLRQRGLKAKSLEAHQFNSAESIGSKLLIIPNPNRKFSSNQFEQLKKFYDNGGSLLVLLNENGEKGSGSNINFFLEEFGISVNSDCVIRTSFVQPYYHPKEVFIQQQGVVHDDFCQIKNGFVYPYGASLNVISPAVPLMTTSPIAFPVNRPIAAFCSQKGTGKLAVVGSSKMFSDKWINREDNGDIADSLITSLLSNRLVSKIDNFDIEYPEYVILPDTIALADRLKSSLQAEADLSNSDMQQMFFDAPLFGLNNAAYPEVHATFEKLDVPADQLSLIKPNFETPLPQLVPATIPPRFCEPDGPQFELFDLDEALSSERVRLAQITNRCNPEETQDLEYMLTSAGEALGITKDLPEEENNPIGILNHIFQKISLYKMPQ